MANSRQKGAGFERQIAKLLHAETGINFKRNLEQYQEKNHSDLTPSDKGWPFSMELKAYAAGTDCRPAWECQAFDAAKLEKRHPAVIWKFNNNPIRCRVWIDAVGESLGVSVVAGGHFDTDLVNFCWLAREIMARRANV